MIPLHCHKNLTITTSLVVLGAGVVHSAANANNRVIWSSSGGGWRAMTANSAFAQVFSQLGLFDITSESAGFDTIAMTSGASWFASQFFFSEPYYDMIVNGNATSLASFTQAWYEEYATTQDGIDPSHPSACGSLEEVCSSLPNDDSSMGQLRTLIAVSNKFNFSMPRFVYEMVSTVYL